jgi:hypothetical protein
MKRLLTVSGLAAMFAVGLAAQSTTGTSGTTAQDPQTTTAGQRGAGPRTITGCLRAGDTAGTYMLTNIEGMGGRNGATGGTTAGSTTTGGTTTDATTAAGGTTAGTAGAQGGGRGMNSLMLSSESSVDLKAHVGHKIEVTGTVAGGGRAAGATTTSGATTTDAGSSTTGVSGTQGGRGGMRSMTVTAVKMISDSCS